MSDRDSQRGAGPNRKHQGLSDAVLAFFQANPGVQLSASDIQSRFGATATAVHFILRKLRHLDQLACVRQAEGPNLFRKSQPRSPGCSSRSSNSFLS